MATPEKQAALADTLERSARLTVLVLLPVAVLVVVDLLSASVVDDRGIDLAMLIVVALGGWSAFSLHRIASRARAGELDRPMTGFGWARFAAAWIVVAILMILAGYLAAGWWAAIALPTFTLVLTGVAVALGRRQKR
jgi:hypothetical protein